MSSEPVAPTWFPEGKIDPEKVGALAHVLMQKARQMGFTRETYAASVAQQAEAICGLPDEDQFDPEVRRYVAERLMAASIALSGGVN